MDCELFAYSIPKLYGDQMTTDFQVPKVFKFKRSLFFQINLLLITLMSFTLRTLSNHKSKTVKTYFELRPRPLTPRTTGIAPRISLRERH